MRVETILKTKKAYNNKYSNTDPSLPFLADFEAACLTLNCWKDNYADVNIFELVRGFIPKSLTTLINNILWDIDLTHTIVRKIVTLLQTRLFKYVWLPRYQDVVDMEALHAISFEDKRAKPSHHHTTRHDQ